MKCHEVFCYYSFPCKVHTTNIEGWDIGNILYEKKNVLIFFTKRKEDKCYTWVMKCTDISDMNEEHAIPILHKHSIQHMVEFPINHTYHGKTNDISWYVMKYYPRICSYVNDHKEFRTLIKTCIEFIKDIHIKIGYVYLDWRLDNILKKQENGFVISDYEFLEKPKESVKPFAEEYIYNKDYLYYFIQLGANIDQPLVSYRTDLEAIGFLAIKFLEIPNPTWMIQCNNIREEKIRPIPVDILATMRDIYKEEIIQEHPCLATYFEKIKECPWESLTCMNAEWYDQLAAIFQPILDDDTLYAI